MSFNGLLIYLFISILLLYFINRVYLFKKIKIYKFLNVLIQLDRYYYINRSLCLLVTNVAVGSKLLCDSLYVFL